MAEQLKSSDSMGNRTSSGSPLMDLPVELVLEIIEWVKLRDERELTYSNLANLSRVNRVFHSIVRIHIYEEYSWRRNQDIHEFTPPKHHLYLRTLMENSNIVVEVRKLRYLIDDSENDVSISFQEDILEKLKPVCSSHVWEVLDSHCAYGSSYERGGHELNGFDFVNDVHLLAPILMHIPNIAEIEIYERYGEMRYPGKSYRQWPWLKYIENSLSPGSSDLLHGFARLTSVSLLLRNIKFLDLRVFFRFPLVRRLYIRAVISDDEEDLELSRWWDVPSRSSPVRELVIKLGFEGLGVWCTAKLLDTCRSLEKFVYRGRWDTITWPLLTDAIHHQKDSLAHLQIRPRRSRVFPSTSGVLGSLTALTKLRYIRLLSGILNDYSIHEEPQLFLDYLPTELLVIDLLVEVKKFPSCINSEFGGLARCVRDRFPNLQRFTLSLRKRRHCQDYTLEDGRWIGLELERCEDTEMTDNSEVDQYSCDWYDGPSDLDNGYGYGVNSEEEDADDDI